MELLLFDTTVQIQLAPPQLSVFILMALCPNHGSGTFDIMASIGKLRCCRDSNGNERKQSKVLESELHDG